jgi:pimeloyl-ACP methyl ester carboxylesterase
MNYDTIRAQVEGGNLYCEVSGEGSPLLLLHGLAVDGRMFEAVVPGLIRHHRIIVPDLRGHGRSARLPGPYTVDRMVQDLGVLLETLGVPSTVVVGYSQGGAVAQALARAHPSKVQGLVLVCTYAHNPLSLEERIEAHLVPTLMRTVGPRAMGALVAALPRVGGGTPMDLASGLRLKSMMASNDRRTMAAASRDAMAFDSRPWLGEIRCPTLVIAGAEDRAVPRAHALMLARGIPGAELRLVEGAGHALAWTHPADLVRLVEEWYDRRGLWRG